MADWSEGIVGVMTQHMTLQRQEVGRQFVLEFKKTDPNRENLTEPTDTEDILVWLHLCMERVLLEAEAVGIEDKEPSKQTYDILRYLVSVPLKYQCSQCQVPGHLSQFCPFAAEIRAEAAKSGDTWLLDKYTEDLRVHHYNRATTIAELALQEEKGK